MSPTAQHSLRFVLPPSLGNPTSEFRGPLIERFLTRTLGKLVQVEVAPNYEALAKTMLSGQADACWAPPFVCARLEAMGIRVIVRGVRNGGSTYRAALVCRADVRLSLDNLQGTTASWVDRDSVAGYLLPLALLRSRGLDPAKTFFAQDFTGSYKTCLEAVLSGKADVAGIFAPPTGDRIDVDEVLPGRSNEFRVLAFSEPVPNDGVAVSMNASPDLVATLEKELLAANQHPEAATVLKEGFHVERFEPAPRLGYRALYRVALASL